MKFRAHHLTLTGTQIASRVSTQNQRVKTHVFAYQQKVEWTYTPSTSVMVLFTESDKLGKPEEVTSITGEKCGLEDFNEDSE